MKIETTPNDSAVLAEIELSRKNGEDPFGDDELDNVAPTQQEAPVDDPVVEAGDPEAEAAVPEVAALPEPVQQYRADAPADYADKRKALMTEKAQAMKGLMDGEIDADAFAEIEARVSGSLEDLMAQRIRAETLHEANLQNTQNQNQNEIRRLIARSKADVDYLTDPKAQKQFDMALSMTQSDPDNAGRDFSDLVADAHKAVMAMRGVMSKGDQVAQAIKSRAPEGKPPVTLRGLPVAATANSGGDAIEALSRLSGQAYEQAYAKLSPSQRAKLLED